MKKFFTLVLITVLASPAIAQVLVQTDFSTYNGLPSSVPFGWYISWNDTSSSLKSYYTSNCGASCPAYKFGVDGAYVISPFFSGADSVRFYLKGNGNWKPNKFIVYGGTDTVNWTQIGIFDSIPLSSQYPVVYVGGGYNYLKFYYQKDSLGYNAGFDDVTVFAGTFSGISQVQKFTASIFPNPGNGLFAIETGVLKPKSLHVTVSNIIGMIIREGDITPTAGKYLLDLRDQVSGIYFLRLHSEYGDVTQRLLIRK
ncbi:MAG: T9SS type A sorting domain-containing protein [Bacteroidia bacterium]|nr:T9SS type A sorting domain-containing protein [Bacteroidia bacterium]